VNLNRVIVIVMAGLAVLLLGCSPQDNGSTTADLKQPSGPPENLLTEIGIEPSIVREGQIEIVQAEMLELPVSLDVNGRIGLNQDRTVRVGAVVDGRITQILASVGDSVKRGQTLAWLHSHEAHDARSEYAKALSELERYKAEVKYYEEARDRTSRLYKLKAGSLVELQKAESELNGARARLKIAEAEARRVLEQLTHIGIDPEDVSEDATPFEHGDAETAVPIRSPQSGVILQRLVTPGTVVTPSDDLFVISELSVLWVHAEVPEAHLASLREGQKAEVRVRAYGNRSFPAKLEYIGDILDPQTRTVPVRCVLSNPSRQLKPEMYATIRFELETPSGVLTIPSTGLQNIDGRNIVFIRVAEARFMPRPVEIGNRFDSRIEIRAGLEAGEEIVGDGSFLLKSELLKFQMAEE